MTQDLLQWAPPSIIEHEAIRARIAGAVAEWSARWFSRRSLRLGSVAASYAPPGASAEGWLIYRGAVAISQPAKAAARLVEWALDARLEHLPVSETDRRLMRSLERRLFADLAGQVELALGVEGDLREAPANVETPFGRLGGAVVGLTEGGSSPLISLGIPLEAVTPLCRSMFPPPPREPALFSSRLAAAGPTAAKVEARLGKVQLSVLDLQGLSAGDVLVLDTAIEDGAVLALRGQLLARASVIEADGRRALSLEASE